MVRKRLKQLTAIAISAVVVMGSITLSTNEVSADTVPTPTRVNVHDPSIVKDAGSGIYYVFGSHLAAASSLDLIQWNQIYNDYEDYETNSIYGNIVENFAESFQWAGYNDGFAKPIAVWAPDVTYNPYYDNGDGTTGAYMMYYSVTSSWRRSCIGYAVSQNVEGPYTYVDTVMYSGFSKTSMYDTDGGASSIDTKWDNDYLNLKELVDLGSSNGGIDEISDNWFNGDAWNNNYAPNAIDPTIFFGPSGDMYMVYGSWSGGLFVLQMNPMTGEVYYPGTDYTDPVSGNATDRYFGTHIAGGNHVSGEGPYILYDAQTEYYYLYETYGNLGANGGYNMRLFRSKNPTGPYVDAAGNNAADNASNLDNYGIKLIGNYQLNDQIGYRSAGHNSAMIDEDGQRYLVYHQRFNQAIDDDVDHQVRVHQQFINQDGWPVTAVYEYLGDTMTTYSDTEVVGTYEFVNHAKSSSSDMLTTRSIELHEDGTITGHYKGTWTKEDGDGCSYVTMVIEGNTYKGVFYRQHTEKEGNPETMTFSVVGDNNFCLWGSMYPITDASTAEISAIPAQTYTGKEVTPAVTVTYQSETLVEGRNYDLVWENNVNAGTAQVTVNFKGNYSGSITKEFIINKVGSALSGTASYKKTYGARAFTLNVKRSKGDGKLSYVSSDKNVATVNASGKITIKGTGKATITVTAAATTNYKKATKKVTITVVPKKITLSTVAAKGNRKVSVKWKKTSKASGYVIQYATSKNFKGAKTATVKSGSTVSWNLTGLKKGKKYYVRVRAYKTVASGKIYGAYSKAKSVTVK